MFNCNDKCNIFNEMPLCGCEPEPTPPTPEPVNYDDITSVIPCLYMGDFIENDNYIPSSCAVVGDYMYIISAPKNTLNTNTGKLYKVSRSQNKIVDGYPINVICGHANSLSYNATNDKFYIAPVFRYDNGITEEWRALIEYNADFTDYNIITSDFAIMGVSYNHVDGNLYCYKYGTVDAGGYWSLGTIYKVNNGAFIKMLDVNPLVKKKYDVNQDFAVYGDLFVISAPQGAILFGNLKSGDIYAEKMADMSTYGGYRRLGELEGMEFDAHGILWAVRFISFISGKYDGIMTQLCYKGTVTAPTPSLNGRNHTFYVNDTSVSQFKNSNTQIKHPSIINIVNGEPIDTIEIDTTADLGKITISKPIQLIIKRLTTSQIENHNDILINPQTDNIINKTGSGALFYPSRVGAFVLGGNARLNVVDTNANNITIGFGYNHPLIDIRQRPLLNGEFANVILADSEPLTTDTVGLYYGKNRVTSTPIP